MKRELWMGLSAVALGGCSLTLGLDDQQPCSSDEDCVYSNGQGSCIDDICMPPGEGPGDTEGTTGSDASSTNPSTSGPSTDPTTTSTDPTTVTDTSSSGTDTDTDTDTDTGVTGCTQNTDCASDQRCGPENTCLDLLSAECQTLQYPDNDDFDRNRVVFLGSIIPVSGTFEDAIGPLENAVQLAVEDFNDTTTLQGDRQIAWVACDSASGPSAAVDAATHLTENVGVPAIIGPAFSESVLAVANNVTVDAGVFIITPASTATSITELEDDDLVWRTIAPDTYQSNGIIDRVAELRALPAPDRMERLLVLAKDDAYGTGLLAAVQPGIEALTGLEIDVQLYENPLNFDTEEELLSSYGLLIGTAVAGLPTYATRADHYTDILFIGTSETQALLYAYFSAWATLQDGEPDPALPRFIFSHASIPELERIVNEIGPTPGTEGLVPLKPIIAGNIEGISPIIFDATNFEAFNIRYRIRFNNQDARSAAGLSYDAALATLFAMASIPEDEPVTGAAIAAAYPSLMDPDGTPVSFSGATLNFINTARNAMAVEGGSVDLQGVSGDLTWDANGDIRTGLFGWILNDTDPDPDIVDPLLTPVRTYQLEPAPSAQGTWEDGVDL